MIQVEQHGPVIAIRLARRFLGKPLYWTTAYYVDGLLIDTGPAVTARELVRVLEQVKLKQIAITHGHEDHIGGLEALRRRYPGIPVYASQRTAEIIQEPELLGMQLYRRLVWGVPAPIDDVTGLEEIADVVRTPHFTLRAVETPGHSRDHVSYYEATQRWLFSGDAFIGGRDRTWAPDYDLFGIVGSLQLLAALQVDRLFPGSGNVRRSPTNDLLEKINYLTQLAREVGRLDAAGMRPEAIATQLFEGNDSSMSFWTQRHFTSLALVEACRSYNALLTPERGLWTGPDEPRSRSGAPGSTNPSARRSTDFGDLIR